MLQFAESRFVTRNGDLAFRRFFLPVIPMAFSLPMAMLGVYFAIYATDVLLVAPAALGTILLVARLFDAVTDPIIGVWSDRRSQPRRIPFLAAGAVLSLSIILLWMPPAGLSPAALVAWLVAAYLLYELGGTLRGVSISALGLEVAKTARRRVLVQVLYRGVAFMAYVAGLFFMQYLIDHSDPRAAMGPVIVGCAIIYAATYFASAFFMREVPKPQRTEERSYVVMLKEVLANRYHLQFLGIQLAEVIAFASLAFAVPYAMRYVFDRPDLTMYVFLTNAVTAVLASFVWWRVIPRFGVRRSWLIGQYGWAAVLAGWVLTPFLGLPLFFALAFISGIVGAAGNCVGYAMLGDIADYDARESGRERQGIYVTIYGLVSKIGLALTGFVLGWILQLSGYTPNEEQETGFYIGITLMISVLPLLGIGLSISLLHRYRLYDDTGVVDGTLAQNAG